MSALAGLAKTLKRSTMFDRAALSRNFNEKFPIITLDLNHLSSNLLHDDHELINELLLYDPLMTINDNLELQIRECGDRQQKRTNVKAYMTDWFMQDKSTGFRWVCDRAIELATKNNPHQVDMMSYDCWGAIYREGDRTIMHNHWPHLWSFVYYVKCPDSSAPLMFDRCIQPNGTIQRILPKTSLMVLFPGWVNHSVPEHSGKDRIVVAGNLSINPFSHIKTIEDRELG